MLNRVLLEEPYKKSYIEELQSYLQNGFDEQILFPKIDSLFNFIKNDYFADTLKMYSNEQIVQNLEEKVGLVPGLKSFIANRKKSVTTQLDSLITSTKDKNNLSNSPDFQLFQNYPNPFNPITTISFELKKANHIILDVYDMNGRKIVALINREQKAGQYSVTFDATGLASGVYLFNLNVAGKFKKTGKMILIH
ncbi:MAG: T9SS C-terminal target domain-containing protein [Calditrichaeota bacterium]|nr:MAG: T9SS C-terminal target domain-containing protein [Calditrichota bacterium]MBL1204646.1 T9SS C-terminal target domain-containing protein [Calditrichota bacterium]NOG44474.1 T9SS type A sorting domain-containing protein [Calditrichota bacterium]